MISSSKDKVGSSSSTKQEEINNTSSSTKDGKNNTTTTNVKASSSISTSSPWLRLKDPRIVRVSRAFGGKDRHSKVCTIRGLRDRRVRLSVPTAIELYDLQDRLGLNQPSKVVDWLLNAAKDEIDELPPLPIPPGSFPHLMTHQAMLSAGNNNTLSSCSKQEFKNMMNNSTTSTASINWEENGDNNARFWNSKGVGGGRDHQDVGNEKEKWMSCTKRDHDHQEEDKQEMISNEAANSSSSFLNRSGGLNFPYGTSFFQLESQNFNPLLSSSSPHHHIGSSSSGHHVVPFPSPLSLSSTTYFPNSANSSMEIDARQIGHFQMLTNSSPTPYSIAQSMRPFHFSMSQPADNRHKDSHDQEFDQN